MLRLAAGTSVRGLNNKELEQMRWYTLRVKHDAGYISIKTMAQSEEAARHIVRCAERCPDRSIRRVYKGKLLTF
jgi:hypothetical protein